MVSEPNDKPTRSTTNDDRMLALEVSNHSLRRQVKAQKEEFASLRNEKDALADAIAQMGWKIEARDARTGETNQINNREDESVNRNCGPVGGSGEPNGSMQNGGL